MGHLGFRKSWDQSKQEVGVTLIRAADSPRVGTSDREGQAPLTPVQAHGHTQSHAHTTDTALPDRIISISQRRELEPCRP